MARIYGRTRIGENCNIDEQVILGYPPRDERDLPDGEMTGAIIGNYCTLRAGGIIYSRATLGDHIRTGHHYLVREDTTVGGHTLIGSGVVIDNDCTIGSHVSLQSMVYIPTGSTIGDRVFLGPRATLTNDMYPVRTPQNLQGPVIENDVSIGAGAVILPGVTVGEGAMVAAGAVVTGDVPAWKLAIGVPAKIKELPDHLKTPNRL